MRQPIRQTAHVAWHLNGGFTTLQYERSSARIDVPTDKIPENLRKIGSRVLVIIHPIDRDDIQTEEQLRRALRYVVEVEQCADTDSI